MRGIKFRAWEKDSKKMFKIARFDFSDHTIYSHLFACDGYLGESCEIMQYTGLKDKNGVEIYEGDIVTSKEYPFQDEGKYNYHGVVEWGKDIAAFIIVKRSVNSSIRGISEGMSDSMEDIEYFNVIGNIYENPELLEKN